MATLLRPFGGVVKRYTASLLSITDTLRLYRVCAL